MSRRFRDRENISRGPAPPPPVPHQERAESPVPRHRRSSGDVLEVLCKRQRGCLTHIAYAKRVQEARQGRRVLRRQSLSAASAPIYRPWVRVSESCFDLQRPEDPPAFAPNCGPPVAQRSLSSKPLNIECTPRGEVLDLLLSLRGANPDAGAPGDCLIRLAHHRRSAHRTNARQLHELCSGDSPFRQHSRHFRNDISGTANDDGIAHPHVFSRQFIHVVQGRIADGDPADEHRLEPRYRGQRGAGAPHLKFDSAHRRQRLFGRKFVGNRPTRRREMNPSCR